MTTLAAAKEVVVSDLLAHVKRCEDYLARAPKKHHADIERLRRRYIRRIERALQS